MMRMVSLLAMLLTSAVPVHAQDAPLSEQAAASAFKRAYSPYVNRSFPTNVYFGDTHLHTALSGDASGAGTTLMPDDAYRFARGEQVTSNTGQPAKLSRPLDFLMVTDHSDGMGAIVDLIAGEPTIMATEQGRELNAAFAAGGSEASQAALTLSVRLSEGTLDPAINYQPGHPNYKRVWEGIVDSAERFYEPGVFTTFAAYEWTSIVDGNNLHRNVIYRDGPEKTKASLPYTTSPPIGSPDPRKLWEWMENYEATTGGDVIAIPHNGNLSNGMMFPLRDDFAEGGPLDQAYAEARTKWERLYEITQTKGDGEAHPALSPNDEFADFETWDNGNLALSIPNTPEALPGQYARSGLLRGLELQGELGANPFKFGIAGGTDAHGALSTHRNENNFGKLVFEEPSAERAMHLSKINNETGLDWVGHRFPTGGLTAVWARENTREAIFDSMDRREAYGTTGTRIRLRFFGGYGFDQSDAARRDLAHIGYSKGVPMGSDLPKGDGSPSFLVYALRDPMGANLDRVQIIKGWIDADGNARERVFDVAWSDDRVPDENGKVGPVGSTVDLSIPSWTNTIGASELGGVWVDPDFDPAERAFYYARVIEIPTPRWTAYDAVRFDVTYPDEVNMVTQERAYSSPIWYTPAQ